MDHALKRHTKADVGLIESFIKCCEEDKDCTDLLKDILSRRKDAFLNISPKTQCEGLVASRNNIRCTCLAIDGEVYCKRHLYMKQTTLLVETRRRCIGLNKQRNQCTHHAVHGSEYCKKHAYQADDDDDENHIEKAQCIGINHDGRRCINNAKDGHDLCGIHLAQDVKKSRREQTYPCAHYEYIDDEIEFVCNRESIYNEWCCKKHQKYHATYKKHFKSKCAKDYLESLLDNNKQPNVALNMLLADFI